MAKTLEQRFDDLRKANVMPDPERIPKTPEEFCELIDFHPDDWQMSVMRGMDDPNKPYYVLLNVSRQAGKTQIAATASVYHAITGRNRTVIIISPSQRQSSIMFRRIMGVYHSVDTLVKPKSETALQLLLENNSQIIALPGKEETIRGYTATLLWVEEAALCDDRVIQAALPFVATIKNAKVCMLSTPHGARGHFYHMWKHSAEYERIEISADDCPRLTPGFLKKEKERLGDRMYRQEYMNSFVDTEDSLFRTEVISKCIHDDMESFDDFVNSMDSAFDELEGDEEDAGVSVDELGLEETPLVTPENEEIPVIARLKDGAYEAKE